MVIVFTSKTPEAMCFNTSICFPYTLSTWVPCIDWGHSVIPKVVFMKGYPWYYFIHERFEAHRKQMGLFLLGAFFVIYKYLITGVLMRNSKILRVCSCVKIAPLSLVQSTMKFAVGRFCGSLKQLNCRFLPLQSMVLSLIAAKYDQSCALYPILKQVIPSPQVMGIWWNWLHEKCSQNWVPNLGRFNKKYIKLKLFSPPKWVCKLDKYGQHWAQSRVKLPGGHCSFSLQFYTLD